MIEPRGIVYVVRCSPFFMAMLDRAFDVPDDMRRTDAYFVGEATITSDGFLMCDFVDADGVMHHGAFVAHWNDIAAQANGLDRHIRENIVSDWGTPVQDAMWRWVGADFRGARPC